MNDHRDRVAGVITSATRQSPGSGPTLAAPGGSKRNSGIFSFLKWFRTASKESVASSSRDSPTSSLGSIPFGGSNSSLNSTGTAASFNFIPPAAYTPKTSDRCIHQGPETDTYKARLKQRDKVREKDKNITLRKKYNLFFNRDKGTKQKERKETGEENHKELQDNCKSLPLPLMTKTKMSDDDKGHRRTNSDSSKGRKAGAYLHVKGKRKAPPPPPKESSLSLRRKKRLAPPPPVVNTSSITLNNAQQNGRHDTIEYADVDNVAEVKAMEEVIQNDCLKLDHGVLKPTKDQPALKLLKPQKSPLLGIVAGTPGTTKSEIPVSPKPWYKRATSSKQKRDRESKYELVIPPFIVDNNNHKNFKLDKEKEDKRKSNIMFLTNISELDREASELIKLQASTKQKRPSVDYELPQLPEMPQFMKPKLQEEAEVQVAPAKRKSAKDLIAKFNAITSVTKVTVNSAFFNPSEKNYFGKKKEVKDTKANKDVKRNGLMKSETTTCILPVPTPTPTTAPSVTIAKVEKPELLTERKSWLCPKCNLENDYWRIICHVCSTIKPYFDNFTSSDSPTVSDDSKVHLRSHSNCATKKENKESTSSSSSSSSNSINLPTTVEQKVATSTSELPILMRSKTQISFSANRHTVNEVAALSGDSRREEKEKLKKMLIEMKNSLPKRKSNVVLQNRKSTIDETPEMSVATCEIQQNQVNSNRVLSAFDSSNPNFDGRDEKMRQVEEKIVQKEKEIRTQKEQNGVDIVATAIAGVAIANIVKKESPYQLLRPKDFEDIYSEKLATVANANTTPHLYANLPSTPSSRGQVQGQGQTPKELFFNVPRKLSELKQNLACGGGSATGSQSMQNMPNAADTLEINKLLRRLENAIAKGDLNDAAGYAKDLAQLKVNCSVIRQKGIQDLEVSNKANRFTVEMYVEDRLSHRGPFPIEVHDSQTVQELKRQVQQEFEIPCEVQRWILGKELAGNDSATLKEHNVAKGCPIFLYLVAPSAVKANKNEPNVKIIPIEVKELNVEAKPKISGSGSNLPVPTSPAMSSKVASVSSVGAGFVRSEKSAFAVVPSVPLVPLVPSEKEKVKSVANSPKIVGEHLKVHVMIKPKSNAETQIGEIAKAPVSKLPQITKTSSSHAITTASSSSGSSALTTLVTAVKTSVIVQTAPAPAKTPPKAEQEDFSEYDKTMRPPRTAKEAKEAKAENPQAHWICHMCTLVNAPTANICSVCATVRQKNEPTQSTTNQLHYYELMHLDNSDLVPNSDPFECLVCLTEVPPRDGVTLRECLHQFCKTCLAHTIEFCEEAEVKCPYRDADYSCDIALQDREIKALVTRQAYEQFLAKSVAQAENKMDKTFHCKTPDCTGWCVYEDNVNEFRCPICKKTNCLTCQAIHWGLNCRQYQEHMNSQPETNEDARQTREWLNAMVEKGEALTCPACRVVLMKKWGCDWVRCSMCKTEICWVTRGLRWGPAGKGDTSGGCKCGVNGVKCHAKCNYCH